MSTTNKNPEQEREQKFLRRYIEYCRAMCSPRQGLTLVHVRAQLEQLQDTFMT